MPVSQPWDPHTELAVIFSFVIFVVEVRELSGWTPTEALWNVRSEKGLVV